MSDFRLDDYLEAFRAQVRKFAEREDIQDLRARLRVQVDVKYLPQRADEDRRRYLFVAIDRANRWVCAALKADQTARSARALLGALARACPRLLIDNGTAFTDRLFGSRARQPTGQYEFDRLCQALGIEHRLTRPGYPQPNGLGEVFERERSSPKERFNGTLADPGSSPGQALLRTHFFRSNLHAAWHVRADHGGQPHAESYATPCTSTPPATRRLPCRAVWVVEYR